MSNDNKLHRDTLRPPQLVDSNSGVEDSQPPQSISYEDRPLDRKQQAVSVPTPHPTPMPNDIQNPFSRVRQQTRPWIPESDLRDDFNFDANGSTGGHPINCPPSIERRNSGSEIRMKTGVFGAPPMSPETRDILDNSERISRELSGSLRPIGVPSDLAALVSSEDQSNEEEGGQEKTPEIPVEETSVPVVDAEEKRDELISVQTDAQEEILDDIPENLKNHVLPIKVKKRSRIFYDSRTLFSGEDTDKVVDAYIKDIGPAPVMESAAEAAKAAEKERLGHAPVMVVGDVSAAEESALIAEIHALEEENARLERARLDLDEPTQVRHGVFKPLPRFEYPGEALVVIAPDVDSKEAVKETEPATVRSPQASLSVANLTVTKLPEQDLPVVHKEDVDLEDNRPTLPSVRTKVIREKTSWYGKFKGRVKKHAKSLSLAATLAAAAAGLLAKNQMQQDTVSDTSSAASSVTKNSAAGATSVSNLLNKDSSSKLSPKSNKTVSPAKSIKGLETPKERKIAQVLENSKSPVVKNILEKGYTYAYGDLIGNSMLAPFQGLASDAKRAELLKLRESINMGFAAYMYENFGTPEKAAESIKDPAKKNLYKTALVMKKNGWLNENVNRNSHPQEYALAEKILADSHDLGLDQSSSKNPDVRAAVAGNMFQAKVNGEKLQLRKADGSYHVVIEMVIEIFNGSKTSDLLTNPVKAPAVETQPDNSGLDLNVGTHSLDTANDNNTVDAGTPIEIDLDEYEDADIPVEIDLDEYEDADAGASIMPNIAPINSLDTADIDAEWDNVAAEIEANEVDAGWDDIQVETPKTEEQKVDDGWDDIDVEPPKTEEQKVDDGWDEAEEIHNDWAAEVTQFETEKLVDVAMPLEMTRAEQRKALVNEVATKIATLYPEANTDKVKGLVKRYGYIGFAITKSGENDGLYTVKLNKNFYKILTTLLKEKNLSANS